MPLIEKNPVLWNLDLTPIMDCPVILVTDDGARRKTMITKVDFKDLKLGNMLCPVPWRFIFENDPSDWADIRVIQSITKVE